MDVLQKIQEHCPDHDCPKALCFAAVDLKMDAQDDLKEATQYDFRFITSYSSYVEWMDLDFFSSNVVWCVLKSKSHNRGYLDVIASKPYIMDSSKSKAARKLLKHWCHRYFNEWVWLGFKEKRPLVDEQRLRFLDRSYLNCNLDWLDLHMSTLSVRK